MASNLRQATGLLSIVNMVGEALSLADEPLKILDSVLDTLIAVLPIDCCWVQMLDEHSGELKLVVHRGLTPELAQETASMKLEQSLSGQVALSGQPIVMPDLSADSRYSPVSPSKAGQYSLAAIPLRSKGRIQGIIGTSSSTRNQFTKEVVELLTVIGNHVSIALDKANLYQQTRAKEEELRESEEKYRSLFEEATDAISLADANTGYILDANREAERLLGYPLREIIGMHQSQLHPPERVDYYQAIFRHHVEVRDVTDFEAEVIKKDGTIVPVYMSFSIIPFQYRKLIQIIFKDITEHKRAEREMRVKNSAIASSIDAIAFADLKGNLTYVNHSFLKMWGHDNDNELLGKPLVKFWQAEDKAAKVFQELRHTGSWIGELISLRKDGSTFDVQLSASVVRDEAGQPICTMCIFVDVTESKRAEGQISEQSRRLNAISQLTKVISSDLNINEVFESFAQQLRGLLNFDRLSISLIEDNKVTFFAISSVAETELDTGTTIPLSYSATGWVAKHKTTLIQPDLARKSLFPLDKIRIKEGLRSSIHVPLFSKGQAIGSLNLSSSKTGAYGENEQELLEQLAAQIAGAIQNANLYSQERVYRLELEKQKEEWSSFTSMAAHELKTPLTSIIAGAELLSDEIQETAPELQQRLVQNIVRSAHSLETALDELLDITKTRGPLQVQLSPLNIKGVAEQAIEYLRPIAERKEQSLILELPDFLPSVNADAPRLEQVLRNLLMNAVKFTPTGGSITLRAMKQTNNLVVEVQDSGIGIAKEKQAALFEPYYRAESDRELFPGVGLGLALSKQIVELHGGRIWVDSEPGKGSTFAFSLPL